MTKICMLAYTYYLSDPRVRREAEALADRGYGVDVLCLHGEGEKPRQQVNGVRVIRLPQSRYRGHRSWAYVVGYARFFILSFLWLTWFHLRKGYQLIQVHTMPDFLAFAALVPKILGAKIVLDIHDLMPELYSTKFGLAKSHPLIKVLKLQERLSARFAHRVIAVHEPQRRLLVD
ncbi:glycosyltransferase, partial [bacterium]|nr:glycosyltransferase [bacterium]